ncbi:hypothetical protein [Streptomyces himalayensis]|uniref:Membrane-bound hydrophilic protein n=1 Tax=Streptomyces himalayensis subsp. himalayensis TaxID=2756131 RepID=A0A7W0DGG2_9ACTN|nr:hypothetical protein [Streptomyces himalayensis]MBA2944626.1 hypothetical protein [Streptomyces himalayensis subsp. himalayensis]
MPADEVTHGTEVDESRVRTGPRHAAPKKPLFTRFHMPAGKAIAMAAMPTAVLMGMGFTPTLARADDQPSTKNLTVDEYQSCVEALEDSADGKDASATPSPSASASESATESDDKAEPTPSASKEGSSSSDSGSDEEAEPAPSASSSSASTSDQSSDSGTSTAAPAPSASASGDNLLDSIGDAIKDVFEGGSDPSASASPTPTPSASAGQDTSGDDASDTVKDTVDKVTGTVEDTVKDTTDAASKAAEDTTEKVTEAATASPSPTTDAEDCPAATDEEGGVEKIVALPDDPWYLDASSLLLKGADYQGIVKVKTANGTVKEVLKYVISDGTDIGDLHQTVKDDRAGRTYHVQAAKGSTSTIRDGKTVMYTESISGNLFGLVPITFSPENPPPLNIPLIYFTKVKVVQAGQFGGTLHVPGLHQYTTELN